MDPIDLPLRHHHIRAMLRSPAHYLAVRLGQADDDPTYAMERGSGLHEMLAGKRAVLDWENGRPRRGKDYDAFVKANPGALILTASDHRKARDMYDAVMSDPVAAPYLASGEAERTIQWEIPGFGLGRTTPDRVFHRADGSIVIVEVKTAAEAEPDAFTYRSARRYGYHTQAAWHAAGVLAECSTFPPPQIEVVLVVIESAAPYIVSTIRVSDALLSVGAAEIQGAIEKIKACRASSSWPGYTPEPYLWLPDERDLIADDDE